MRCGEEIELCTSSMMWAVWIEEENFTHHTRRKSNFDRLLYIIFVITQIHRVRFVSVKGEATRVKPSKKKKKLKESWKKVFRKENCKKKKFGKKRKKNWKNKFENKMLKKILEKSFNKNNVGEVNYTKKYS